MLSSCWLYFCVNVEGYYPWARMLSSPLRSVICVRLSERQDLLLADNFRRQIESGIGSFQILFIDNWAKTNPLLLLINYSGTYKNEIARVSVSVWNECCDPPLLPVATQSLQLQDRWNVQRLTQSCIQYLHNFTLSQHELRFILSALKAGSSLLPLHFISPTSIPLHVHADN